MKKKYRQIIIDGRAYLWKFTPRYVKVDETSAHWECQDCFTAFLLSAKKSLFQIYFRTWEDALIGGPLRVGAPLQLDASEAVRVNLHTPGWAAWLIRQARNAGWSPEQSQQPFVIEQGVNFLIAKLSIHKNIV